MAILLDDSVGDGQFLNVEEAVVTAVPFTMHCWFNSDDISKDQYVVSIGDASATNHFVGIQLRGASDDKVAVLMLAGGGVLTAVSSNAYLANTWYPATAVCAAANDRKIYFNGEAGVISSTPATMTGIDQTTIGRSADYSPFGECSGMLAEVAIWDVALTDWECQQLAIGFSPKCLTSKLPHLKLYKSLRRFINDPDDVGPGMQAWSNDALTTAAMPSFSNHPPTIIDPPVVATRLLPVLA